MKRPHSRPLGALFACVALASATSALPAWIQDDVDQVHPPLGPPAGSEVTGQEVFPRTVPGERLPADAVEISFHESAAEVMARQAALPPEQPGYVHRERNGAQGTWIVPSRQASSSTHSGEHYATNAWGDARMGVGFGGAVDLEGVFALAHGTRGAWARGLQVVGYRDGREVARTEWTGELGEAPVWLAIDFAGVHRVEFLAKPAFDGAGFYGIDDLTFERDGVRVVVDFDDLDWKDELTGSGYAGLRWETGTGEFAQDTLREVHPPEAPPGADPAGGETIEPPTAEAGGGATLPALTQDFVGPFLGDEGAGWLPPDTHGAIGPEHFVSVVNMHLSVYDRDTGARLLSTSLQNFFSTSGSVGDPRVLYDHHAARWVIMASNFSSGVRFAYSHTSDPMGAWLKAFINMAQGADGGRWPDYPLMGLDQNGIYLAAYMVGGSRMSIFAMDKTPLVTGTPSLGTITAWRDLPWEGAIQPCVTHGTPPGEYLVSQASSTSLRLRRVNPPLASPTLTELGFVTIPTADNAPSAPALGSTVNLSTVDRRPMNSVYRNGSVWCAHTITRSGRAACRWYEIDAGTVSTVQVGNIEDSTFYYFFPAIAVNARGDVVVGFTGSHAGSYAGAFYTGRLVSDPPNEMAVPAVYHAGEGPYNHASSGTNRWGDYSMTTVDPRDDLALWTIQEYGRSANNWGTWVAKLEFGGCLGSISNYCIGSPSSTGFGSALIATGSTSIAANDFGLTATLSPPGQFGVFFMGPNQVQIPFGDGFLCLAGGIVRFNPPILADAFGEASIAIDVTSPPAAGLIVAESTWNFQWWYRDPAGMLSGFNTSDAIEATFCE